MGWYFAFFLVSGFAGLVYEIVWLRIAMAKFGVTTPLVSTVLSVFMLGLGVGSWAAGSLARRLDARGDSSARNTPLLFYSICELVIGLSGFAVPSALGWGRRLLEHDATGVSWASSTYYLASGAWIAVTLLPACVAMGATFPLGMGAIARARRAEAPARDSAVERSFSFLYLANVLGATSGTVLSAFVLIELLGLRGTVNVAVALNLSLAVCAFALGLTAGRRSPATGARGGSASEPASPPDATPESARRLPSAADSAPPPGSLSEAAPPLMLLWLFLTGLASMAMEVIWTRAFAPYLGNEVYGFAAILATYLAATFVGSWIYRQRIAAPGSAVAGGVMMHAWIIAGVVGLVPLVAADPRIALPAMLRLAIGIVPICGVFGFLTPMLVDRWASGDPRRAGFAYAANVLGSIVGPLIAGFWLVPSFSERGALTMLVLPLFVVSALAIPRPALVLGSRVTAPRVVPLLGAAVIAAVIIVTTTRSFESSFAVREVRRDHTATVIATGGGLKKDLLINGYPTTVLTDITKWLAHLPLASLPHPPRRGLVICFGMGTTFRSMLSWGIPTTAVELVPSVPRLFGYYYADGPRLMQSPLARIVIDDGRRFLDRTTERYDVITIDPPNPIEAAGSSALYSREFYAAARARLTPGGIVSQWIPTGHADLATMASVARALRESFPHVRALPIVKRGSTTVEVLGVHFLASMTPVHWAAPAVLASRVPPPAAEDLREWEPGWTTEDFFRYFLSSEMPLDALIALAPSAPPLEDDRPFNEYYFLRRWILPVQTAGPAAPR